MRKLLILSSLSVAQLLAQPVVAPTDEPVGAVRGENVSGYNITNSFETGYRFHETGGNALRYRSDINFGNGLRLLGSTLTVNSRDGKGKLFDEIVLTTQGLGNDPYEFANLRIQRNKIYRYDMLWRTNDYFNPGLTTGTLGGHLLNTRRQMQDHDFSLFPQSRLRFFAGTSFVTQTGPGLTSVQLFDTRGDEFPLFGNIDRRFRELRAGAELRLAGFRFLAMQGWQRFEESTAYTLQAASAGANPLDNTTLSQSQRTEPYSGSTPFWRFNLLHDRKSWYSVGARFYYAGSRRTFTYDELSSGTDRLGNSRARQILVAGSGRRPLSYGTLTLSLFPSDRVTITNHTAFQQVQMDGDNLYREINNSTQGLSIFRFNYLGIRTFVNSTDATFQAQKWLSLYGGFHYSDRRIRSREAERIASSTDTEAFEQSNTLKSGLAGVRMSFLKSITFNLDGELGRADRPIFPLSDRNYHAVRSRLQYKTKSFVIGAGMRTFYNTNSISLFVHSSRSRNYNADLSWTPRHWFSLDTGYAKIHVDSATALSYFAAGQNITGDQSIYVSNLHTVNLGTRLSLRKRVDLYLGYSRVQDAGDGRATIDQPSGALGSQLSVFRAVQTFPLAYQSPLARFSLRLHQKVRWNVGYQFYNYDEKFFNNQNYRAHTGYTSLLWSF
ncbi:MAG: hypothetical protein IT168_29620 [Bryobacterales bacterium]|nr:hypothetical protein [Bryobacterales bacterium]